jgi:hypothetical protein
VPLENHAHSVALFVTYYDLVRVDKTVRVTLAMAANVTRRLWEHIVDVLEAWGAKATQPTKMEKPPTEAARDLSAWRGVFRLKLFAFRRHSMDAEFRPADVMGWPRYIASCRAFFAKARHHGA